MVIIEEPQNASDMFLDSKKFFKAVDDVVWDRDMTYLEGIMVVCDEKNIDPDELVRLKLISPLLKSLLQEEGELTGQLKPSASLPI